MILLSSVVLSNKRKGKSEDPISKALEIAHHVQTVLRYKNNDIDTLQVY